MAAPLAFRRSIRSHNSQCWIAAGFSLAGAWLAWLLFGAFYTGFVLLFATLRSGDAGFSHWPEWLVPVGLALATGLLAVAAVLRFRHRYRPVTDRPIIGFHLAPDFVLLPARLTFSIWDHLAARVRLDEDETQRAWELLQVIHASQRLPVSTIRSEIGNAPIDHLLDALQLTGWIDLHRGENDWFYRLRSSVEPEFIALRDGRDG